VAQRGTTERVLMGCGALAILSVLVAVLLSLGIFLGRSDVEVEAPVEEAVDELGEVVDEQPENVDIDTVVVRVSGPQGTAYSGTYGTTKGGMLPADGVLGAVPAEYRVETGSGAFGAVSAVFQKTQPVPGIMKVELVADGVVMAVAENSEELGSVQVNWDPRS
jgi:hypothetical protein